MTSGASSSSSSNRKLPVFDHQFFRCSHFNSVHRHHRGTTTENGEENLSLYSFSVLFLRGGCGWRVSLYWLNNQNQLTVFFFRGEYFPVRMASAVESFIFTPLVTAAAAAEDQCSPLGSSFLLWEGKEEEEEEEEVKTKSGDNFFFVFFVSCVVLNWREEKNCVKEKEERKKTPPVSSSSSSASCSESVHIKRRPIRGGGGGGGGGTRWKHIPDIFFLSSLTRLSSARLGLFRNEIWAVEKQHKNQKDGNGIGIGSVCVPRERERGRERVF